MMRLIQDEYPNNSNNPQCLHCLCSYVNHFNMSIAGFCSEDCQVQWHLEADKTASSSTL
jgi:hypothetical protein